MTSPDLRHDSPEPRNKGENTQDKSRLLGALYLSVAGSLPLHLVPLIVVALVADGTGSRSEAGWIVATILVGQLSASLTAPLLSITYLSRRMTIVVVALLLLGLGTTALGGVGLYGGWLLVGWSCGALLYLGTASAAHHRNATFAFSVRLGLVLILAGAVSAILLGSNALVSYQALLLVLFPCFGVILVPGMLLYRPPRLAPQTGGPVQLYSWHSPTALGLATLFVLFTGQTGFLAYVAQAALDRGMGLAESTWAIVAMKVLAGLWLICLARPGIRNGRRDRFLVLGVMLGASLVVASLATGAAIFFAGLFCFELTFNTLAARLQARIAETDRHFSGRWLTVTMLLGAACGPPLHGVAISVGLAPYFLAFAFLSAILPALWTQVMDDHRGPAR